MNFNLDHVIAERPTKKVYRDGNLTIKLFHEGYSATDILNEAMNHAIVHETGFQVPRLETVTKIDNQWAIVIEYIEGQTLAELMEQNPQHMDAYLNRLVDVQLKIHSYTAPRLRHLTDKMHAKISASSLDYTTRYELHTRLASLPKHNKMCHGDYNPSNVIITADDKAYVIDWAHATQGNASADVARTYLLFKLAREDDQAEKYLNLFCQKSNTAKQYVQKWMSIVAASQLVKGNPEERDFLMHWTNVVEYE